MLRTALATLWLIVIPVLASDTVVVLIGIEDMPCPACSRALAERLRQAPGLVNVVSVRAQSATVASAQDTPVDGATLRQAIVDAGFRPGVATLRRTP